MPDVEVLNLKMFRSLDVLDKLQGLWVSQNSEVLYVLAARITFICAMSFEAFPLDIQTCLFQVSFSSIVTFNGPIFVHLFPSPSLLRPTFYLVVNSTWFWLFDCEREETLSICQIVSLLCLCVHKWILSILSYFLMVLDVTWILFSFWPRLGHILLFFEAQLSVNDWKYFQSCCNSWKSMNRISKLPRNRVL